MEEICNRNLEFEVPSKIVIGNGVVEEIGKEAIKIGSEKVLIVTDRAIVEAGIYAKVQDSLERVGLESTLFQGVEPDPRTEIINDCLRSMGDRFDLVVGLGGGSSLDIAKIISVMITNSGKIEDYLGIDKIPKPGIPKFLIPTTAGTGSEVTPYAILTDDKERLKKAVVSSYLFADIAIIDPLLTITLPPKITSYTGMDALTHAIETYTSTKATIFSDMLALEAIKLISENLPVTMNHGDDISARYKMSMASLLAGLNLHSTGTGAVHALAYPLGGMFNIPHGIANSLLLPYVMEFNLPSTIVKYSKISETMAGDSSADVVKVVKKLSRKLAIPQHLRDLEIPRDAITALAKRAMQVTRLLANNPRKVTLQDAIEIYKMAY